MEKENLGAQAGVHLREGVRLIWGLFNTGFIVETQEVRGNQEGGFTPCTSEGESIAIQLIK